MYQLVYSDAVPVSQKGTLHQLIFVLVWVTIASNAFVFVEPAPVDLLNMGLIVLLPAFGLVRLTPGLSVFLVAWLLVAAAGLIACSFSPVLARSVTHTLVTLYLSVYGFVLAAFIARAPLEHSRLILSAYVAASILASCAALAGYFSLTESARDLFTLHDRAAGTFKDPNVLGPFLVLSVVWMINRAIVGNLRECLVSVALIALFALVTLLTFSRGAWLNLALSTGIYFALSVCFAFNARERFKTALIALTGLAVLIATVLALSQNEKTGSFLAERASLTQSYDEGPDGRFGGQQRAAFAIAHEPLGLGPHGFRKSGIHSEDAHNVYLSMLLNAGWIGGGLYIAIVLMTLFLGLRAAVQNSELQTLQIICVAVFAGHAIQGLIIDTDHWRHFFLLMSLVLGLSCGGQIYRTSK